MITPNKYKQALKEIQELRLNDEVLEAIKKIQESEKDYFFFLGIKARKSKDEMSMNYTASPQFLNVKSYDKMKKQMKEQRFKGLFADKFTKVVLLHDPFYKAPVVKKKEAVQQPAEDK